MNKLIINQQELKSLVSKICRNITISGWRPEYVVGITRGGLIPAVMISHYFDIPMKPLQISLRDGGDTVSDLGMAEDAFAGKNILVVDDINDQGSTLNWLMKDWPSGCFPYDERWDPIWGSNVRFAVVVDNLASQCSIGMNYYGMEVNKAEEDVWIEFPYEQWWEK
jgi:xanthine phosphoribosyltransferase